ncbi:hypothetical protein SAMN05660831_01017 [Thiohalospira halophila DSM 15071]|uniref:Uncharacterized protein n=1 Tax=Thiohalospira halophila DSM 15071 TaxID=1123397 RepID=A0A1I1QER4_9GAMM|nr:hypothetical protein [Thiohalospira halophila]SFD17723.1 hypothetical protein SAMN05660831_01017 [Thiohalospira halophila DSM 15071]
MEIGGSGNSMGMAMQLMQSAGEVRGQTTQQLSVVDNKISESKGQVLQQATQAQNQALERKSNVIDVMA